MTQKTCKKIGLGLNGIDIQTVWGYVLSIGPRYGKPFDLDGVEDLRIQKLGKPIALDVGLHVKDFFLAVVKAHLQSVIRQRLNLYRFWVNHLLTSINEAAPP